MHKIHKTLLVIGFFLLSTSLCMAAQKPLQGHNPFALKLFGQLTAKKPNQNLFISPTSIYSALAMTWAGARKKTAKEMANVLGIEGSSTAFHEAMKALLGKLQTTDGVELSIANSLWMHKTYKFLPSFVSLIRKSYRSTTNEVDFKNPAKVRKQINNWVAEKTKKLITELIPSGALKTSTRLVLTNAIYFNGKWQTRFDKNDTAPMPFTTPGGNSVTVPMMRLKAKFKFASLPSLKILSMPYKGDAVSMVVLLPKSGSKLADLRNKLSSTQLETWLGQLSKQKIRVRFPKFKSSSFHGLKPTLKKLGMPSAFGNSADFSGLNGKKDLQIQKVLHKAFIEVAEEGTKAGASTAVIIGRKGVSRTTVFFANRPFIYLIRHNATGQILFLGQLTNPSAK